MMVLGLKVGIPVGAIFVFIYILFGNDYVIGELSFLCNQICFYGFCPDDLCFESHHDSEVSMGVMGIWFSRCRSVSLSSYLRSLGSGMDLRIL